MKNLLLKSRIILLLLVTVVSSIASLAQECFTGETPIPNSDNPYTVYESKNSVRVPASGINYP